jgi:arylsulfatase A-like enzyme
METTMRWTLLGPLALGVTALIAGCGGGGDSAPPPAAPAARPNILMILADDLGYSDIGAFGGEISTPNLDALVASGRVLTDYHTGATCSPTRSMLMSGTDHHIAGLGSMAELVGVDIAANVAPWGAANTYGLTNLPDGYEGYLNDNVLSLPQVFKDGGYHTYMAGKWHLATAPESPAVTGFGPFKPYPASFPGAKGFERSFALVQGAGSHFAPVPGKPIMADLGSKYIENDQAIALPSDFYSSTSYANKLIEYLEADKDDNKPVFGYLAFTAPHWPLQAPDADIAKYAGRYDEGYEVIRSRRIARQKALGLIPADFNPNAGLDSTFGRPKWDSLTPTQKAMEARKMEVYAAMVENMDRNIGRVIQYLKDTGRYENTLIVFASDNGAEGAPNQFPDNANTDNSLANIGRPLSNVTYGERWAEVSAAPFRLWKGMATEGGVAAPLVVRLPGQSAAKPKLSDLVHISDLLPTFLEAAGIANPGSSYGGRTVSPITGVSMLARLQDRTTNPPRGANDVLADELFTGRYVIRDHWKLVSVQAPFGDNSWQLFDLSNDRGESYNVIESNPTLAAQLMAEYDAYAARVGVVFAPGGLARAAAP